MKASALVRDPNGDRIALDKLTVGETVSGVVKRVAAAGVFVTIANTNIVGLARKQHALTEPNSNKLLTDEYTVGDVVRAKVYLIILQLLNKIK